MQNLIKSGFQDNSGNSTQPDTQGNVDILQLFMQIHEGLFYCDKNGLFRFINPAGAHLLGFDSPDELTGCAHLDLMFQTEEKRKSFYSRLDKSDEITDFVVPYQSENGWEKFISINCFRNQDDEHPKNGFYGSITDVTKRIIFFKSLEEYSHSIEETLHSKTNEFLEKTNEIFCILSQFPFGTIILDNELKVESLNNLAQEWFGPGDQLIGKHISEILTQVPDSEDTVRQVKEAGLSRKDIIQITLTNHQEMQVRFQATPLHNQAGEVEKVIITLEDVADECIQLEEGTVCSNDIRERVDERTQKLETLNKRLLQHSGNLEKSVQERTRDLNERNSILESMLASLGQGIILANENGIIQQVNRKACEYFHAGEKEIKGSHIKCFCMLEKPDEINELYRRYGEEGDEKSYTDQVEYFGHWFRVNFSRMKDQQGEFIGVLLNIQDIHDKKLLEDQTRETAIEQQIFTRELGEAKDRMEEQAGKLILTLEELKLAEERVKKQNEKMVKDLDSARRIQRSLLPNDIPEGTGIQFGFSYNSCEHVGGDFFDIFWKDENHIALYLADVSGHGVSAAMLAVFAKQTIKSIESTFTGETITPDKILERLNQEIIKVEFEDMPFLTIFYGVIDTRDLTLDFAVGAHPAPLVINQSTGDVTPLEFEDSTPLGWFLESEYKLYQTKLSKGDRFLLFTDGVTEIFNPEGELLEEDDFNKFLSTKADLELDDFSKSILVMIRDFMQKDEQDDDITLITMDMLDEARINEVLNGESEQKTIGSAACDRNGKSKEEPSNEIQCSDSNETEAADEESQRLSEILDDIDSLLDDTEDAFSGSEMSDVQ